MAIDPTSTAGATDPRLGDDAVTLAAPASRAFAGGVSRAAASTGPSIELGEQPGAVVGNYQLLSVLGEGGFGVVWLALQREPIVRQVALKILKPGAGSRQVLARFEQERQALALMDHQGIAKVFDAGADQHGRPYFVMELVRGRAITTYCDDLRLGIQERLGLFAQVCDAVQHAHTKGIIHRDLKPSNVLVDESGEGGAVVKVIDFGVAKAVEHALTDKTLFTEAGQILGTPEYMSPEQADADARAIDTRTDVYSLGVLLYELLTGALPFDPGSLRSAGYREIQRIIREVDPPRPSARLSSLGAAAGELAQRRRVGSSELAGTLRRELEWIPLKAMRKEPKQRYQSPADLAADVRRYIDRQPLAAGPESAVYRARKFVRRNRMGVVIAAGLAIAGVIGVASIAYGYVQTSRAYVRTQDALKKEQDALAETTASFDRTRVVNLFLKGLFRAVDPSAYRPGAGGGTSSVSDVTIVAAMDDAIRRLDDGELAGNDAAEAELRATIGSAYLNLGRRRDAEKQLVRALALEEARTTPDRLRIVEILRDTAELRRQQGRAGDAFKLLDRAVSELDSSGGPDVQRSLLLIGRASIADDEGEHARAQADYRAALAIIATLPGNLPAGQMLTIEAQQRLATSLRRSGNMQEAIAAHRNGLREALALPARNEALIARSQYFLGVALLEDTQHEEAERVLRDSVELWRRVTPDGSAGRTNAESELARLLITLKRCAEAAPLVREALDRRLAGGGENDVNTAKSYEDLGRVLRCAGDLDPSIEAYRSALRVRERVQGAEHVDTAISLVALADTLTQSGRAADALQFAETAVQRRSARYPASDWKVASARSVLGGTLVALGRFADAEPHLLAAYDVFKVNTFGLPQRLSDVLSRLADCAKGLQKPDEEKMYRGLLEAAAKP